MAPKYISLITNSQNYITIRVYLGKYIYFGEFLFFFGLYLQIPK